MSETIHLEPCPHCGKPAEFFQETPSAYWQVITMCDHYSGKTKEDAAKSWNERTYAKSQYNKLEAEKARLLSALSKIINNWNANAPRLREATGDSVRFQFVDESIQEAAIFTTKPA